MSSNSADFRLFSFPGFADSPPPWTRDDGDSTKAKAVLLQRLYCDSDDVKQRLWVNVIIIFRALLHFSSLQFDRDFHKIVCDACRLASTNMHSIKDLAAYWSRRRTTFLKQNGKTRESSLLTELVDAWQIQFERWRDKRLEYLPNVPRAIETKVEEWAGKMRDIDDYLMNPRISPFDDMEPFRRHSRSPVAARNSVVDANFGRKRSPCPKRETEGDAPLQVAKRRCTAPVGDLTGGTSPSAQIDSLIKQAAQPSSHQNDPSSNIDPAEVDGKATDNIRQYEMTTKELFNSLQERILRVESNLSRHSLDHVPESFRRAQEDLTNSVQRLEDRVSSIKNETDDRLKRDRISSEQLEVKYAKNTDSIAGLKLNFGELESLMNEIRASSAVSTSSPLPNDTIRRRPLSEFRQLYLEKPGLANLVLLTETFLNRIDTRTQGVEERVTRTEESTGSRPQDGAATQEKIDRLEEQIARLTRHVSENERLANEQAEQIQRQHATIQELQTQQAPKLEEMQQQLNAVNLTLANHSSNMGLETRLITVLDLARVYHRREHFKTKAHMEHSARMVVSLEAAVNSLMNSKGK